MTIKVATEAEYTGWLLSRLFHNDSERLGQSFVNRFFKEGMTDPELFYCEDDELVIDLVIKYVDWGNYTVKGKSDESH